MSVLLVDADSLVFRIAANPQVKYIQGQQHILDETISIIADRTNAEDAIFLLTGRQNFRKSIPVPKMGKDGTFEVMEYKANRKRIEPPETLTELREYLKSEYKSTMTFDLIEADDALSYTVETLYNNHLGKAFTIVGIDKDLQQIPGKHFNWVKVEFTLQSPEDAERFRKYQLLRGDPTDNVPGLPGIGEAKANKLLTENPRLDIYDVYLRYYKTIQQPALWFTRTRSLVELLTPSNLDLLLKPYLSREEYDTVLRDLHELYNRVMKKIQAIGNSKKDQDPMISSA